MRRGLLVALAMALAAAGQTRFIGQELLGRVSNHSVTVNVVADRDVEAYFEYGVAPGSYTGKTDVRIYTGGTPFEAVLSGLEANTRYYYRMQYREPGAVVYSVRPERTFQTQRSRGEAFTFVIQFDPHMDENSDDATYKLSLANMLADKPDFLLDLGDNMMSDKLSPPTAAGVLARTQLMRSYYDQACHSIPLFMALGNHEGEWGRNLNGTANNVAVWDTLTRKMYYPNPVPDGFFGGDTKVEPLVGLRQAYYSWEWGDALFVVLDPYWNQPVTPELSGDWGLTLGRAQYDWLKKTLEGSTALYKFVFSHNLVGGLDLQGAMRGGIETAKYLEWGGYNLDGTWGFDRARPGWPMPIHQLLVANNVTAYFHGHDHVYAKQDLDGIVYQEGPQPSARNVNLGTRGSDYRYTHGTVLGGTGYLRARVSPAGVKVEYVQTWVPNLENASRKNGMVADSYTIPPRVQSLKFGSAAGYLGGTVAPESIVSAYGPGAGSGSIKVKDSGGMDRDAVVLGAAAGQVNFVMPGGTASGRARVTVGSAAGDLLVDSVSPGLFTANADGKGVAAAVVLHVGQDGRVRSELAFRCGDVAGSCVVVPIDLGPATDQVYLSIYGTGLRNRGSLADVTATIGGQRAEVEYAGVQSSFPGLDQVNVRVPRSLGGRGEVPVVLSVGGKVANTVTISIR